MANIYSKRRVLTQLLHKELSDNFLVVPNPDHPLLIRGPDILVVGGDASTAIFMPLAMERRSEELLRSRFVLSRLALPPYVRCILISDLSDHHIAQSFSNDFAHIIEWSSRAEVLSIVSSSHIPSRHRDVPPEAISAAQTRFSNAMTIMRLGARLTAKPFSAAFDEKSSDLRQAARSTMRYPRRRPIIDISEGVAVAELTDSDVDPSLVRDIVDQQTHHSFLLDEGIPYPTNAPAGLALVRDWPVRTRDTEKLILSAAFGGWAFVLEELRGELPRFVKRLKLRKDA